MDTSTPAEPSKPTFDLSRELARLDAEDAKCVKQLATIDRRAKKLREQRETIERERHAITVRRQKARLQSRIGQTVTITGVADRAEIRHKVGTLVAVRRLKALLDIPGLGSWIVPFALIRESGTTTFARMTADGKFLVDDAMMSGEAQ